MLRIFLFSMAFIFSLQAYADPLLLTPIEMQKLKKYFPAEDESHYLWKGDAIAITLPLNQEKRLIFPAKVIPDLKGALTIDQLRIINDDKSLYLTAKKPFVDIRMYVTVENPHQVILIDLSTENKNNTADNTSAYIDFNNIKQNAKSTDLITSTIHNNTENASEANIASDNDTYVTLIRFAWQQLFAPTRLLTHSLDMRRVPMHTAYFVSQLIYGDKVTAHPIASWRYQNNIVTALELRNKYPHITHINGARDICGHWQAASLYPRSLLKTSNSKNEDTTILFLISAQPFGETLERCHGSA